MENEKCGCEAVEVRNSLHLNTRDCKYPAALNTIERLTEENRRLGEAIQSNWRDVAGQVEFCIFCLAEGRADLKASEMKHAPDCIVGKVGGLAK